LVNPVTSATALRLLGVSAPTGVDAELLLSAARAKAGVGLGTASIGADPDAPIAPVWTPGVSPSSAALVQRAFSNKAFFDVNAKLYSDLGATGDYKRLFALYSGLTTLQALAGRAEDDKLSASERTQTLSQFSRGLSELEAFFSQQQFEDIRLAQGDRVDAAQTTLAMPVRTEDYATGYIHRGGLFDRVAGLDPNAQFTITATSSAGTIRTVAIDLGDMGSIPRTLGNVIGHVNAKLSAAGAASRLEAVDVTPKENTIIVGGNPVKTRYTGPKQYGIKVDVRAGESVAFQPGSSEPAFYALGATNGGARLIKLTDVGGEGGQPTWFTRPGATADPMGAYVSAGWYGPGAPYGAAPPDAWEKRSGVLMSAGANAFEDALRAAGEAVLKLETADGRVFTVSAGWRGGDQEVWRQRSGEDGDRAVLDDLAERLTQLMHEQGLAGGVDVWEDSGSFGLSLFTSDGLKASSFAISGKSVLLDSIAPSGMVGGLRDGVFARRFEAAAVAGASDLFEGEQTFVITTGSTNHTITIDGGEGGIDAATLAAQLNDALFEKGVPAAASFVDVSGSLSLRIDGLHDVVGASATLNEDEHDALLQAPGAWATGGLPAASAGQPFGGAVRTYAASASPLLTHSGALDIAITIATPTGLKTVNVAVSALERANDPDPAPGEWSATFQARLDAALNVAGVYVGATSSDLTQWSVSESAGQRVQSISVNGDALTLSSVAPSFALGGAFSAMRSFTSAQAATSVSDDVPALLLDQTVSITFDTVWGERAVTATLDSGDPRSLQSAALRLNEALAAQGYDIGVAATALSGGGAGLRLVTGASHTVRAISQVSLGGDAPAIMLDPIDATSHADDPVGALRVAERAARGAAVTLTIPGDSTFTAPSANSSAWFAGRAFDVSVGGGLKLAQARAVAAGPGGVVYVLADVSGDSATSAIKGARDVALLKYDSAGKLMFSEMLGAARSASGFALAVSADGKVAVAGAVEGAFSSASAGGRDSFVSVFDANGAELWTARRGAKADDEINAVAFAPDGGVIVAGRTESALAGQTALGGADGFVRGFDANGTETFARQFGTSGADGVTALLVRDDGAGGAEIIAGGVENNRGVLRRFTYSSSAGFAAGAIRDIGYFLNGAVNALAADGASLYVGGVVGADRLNLGAPARASVAGQEGYVARLNIDLTTTTLDRASYLGSAQDDAVKSLAIVGGAVYAAGSAGGLIAAQGSSKATTGFLTRLDADGAAAWTRTFSSAGGAFTLAAMAASPDGASALDVLGLPRGAVAARDAGLLTTRTALRAGDEFSIGVEGPRLTTIRIGAGDTLASLANTINRTIGAAGKAQVVKDGEVERLKISPRGGGALRMEAGREGRDALGALGLKPGVIAVNSGARGSLKTFGLGLIAADLRLDSKAAIAAAKAELSAAVSIVRQAYEALANPNAKELTPAEKALEERRKNAGVAPEYYTAQLANYQAALARLGGG
jgi:hypothetical protein